MPRQLVTFVLLWSFVLFRTPVPAVGDVFTSCTAQDPTSTGITRWLASCPPGYVLSATPLQGNNYTTCECDTQNPIVVDCNGCKIVIRVIWTFS